jgi:hypothetical protein
MPWRDRLLGAALVLIVPAAQTYWMSAPIILLSGGLIWLMACGRQPAGRTMPLRFFPSTCLPSPCSARISPRNLVEAANLSQRERALLPDPRWITEDDADAIVAARRRRETPVPLEQAMKRYGRRRMAS